MLLAPALLQRVAPHRKLVLSEPAVLVLQAQDYPSNVRELRNLLERAVLLCDGDTLESSHVQLALRSGRRSTPLGVQVKPATLPAQAVAPIPESSSTETPGDLKSLQHEALKQLANAHQGSRAELARKLGISERSLYRKLKTFDF